MKYFRGLKISLVAKLVLAFVLVAVIPMLVATKITTELIADVVKRNIERWLGEATTYMRHSVEETHERLKADDAVRGQLDRRLVIGHELALIQRGARQRHHRALGHVAVFHVGRVERRLARRRLAHAVARVAGAVHELGQGLRIQPARPVRTLHDAGAGVQEQAVRVGAQHVQVVEAAVQLRELLEEILPTVPLHQHHELVCSDVRVVLAVAFKLA